MAILEALHLEHEAVKALFSQTTKSDQAPAREFLVKALRDSLIPHLTSEEDTLYAAMADKPSARRQIQHSLEEHRAVEQSLTELETVSVTAPHWIKSLDSLRSKVDDHIREEEGPVFDAARSLFTPAELLDIGVDYQSRKLDVKQGMASRT